MADDLPKRETRRDERWQIQIRDLHKSFGTQHVLNGVNLDIERGKINIIIGGSGQGKSVLMKHLMGLLAPDGGHIYVDGEDIVGLGDVAIAKIQRKFGMVFQYAALFDSLNVVENIAFPLLERYRLPKQEVLDRVRALLVRLDLAKTAGIEQKFPAELSGGMRKRVGLARALIDRPEILLYDEPTTGLDPIATKNVDQMIRRTADRIRRHFRGDFPRHGVDVSYRGSHRHALRWGHCRQWNARGNHGQTPSRVEGIRRSLGHDPIWPVRESVGMRRSYAALTVGALALVVLVTSYLLFQYTSERMAGGKGYRVYGLFGNAIGLYEKTRVLSAGLRVGQVEERVLDQESGKAKVFLRIDPEIRLYANASLGKKSASLLGEYYLDIDPGTPYAIKDGKRSRCRAFRRATRSRG